MHPPTAVESCPPFRVPRVKLRLIWPIPWNEWFSSLSRTKDWICCAVRANPSLGLSQNGICRPVVREGSMGVQC